MSNYEFWDELGKIFEAVVAYQEKSVEFNKRFIHPWIRLGNVFDKQDRNTEAIRVYMKAIELEPANAQNWYELGNIHFQLNNHAEAAQAYNKAIELAPESGWSYSNLALTLATQGKYVEAVPLYQKGIDLLKESKDQAVAWNRLGNAYRKLDQYELAVKAFQKADALDEENAGFRDQLDEVQDGPSLVEGVGSESAGSETEMIIEPVLLSLAESAVEEPSILEAAVETEIPIPEPQAEIVEALADVLENVADTQAQDTLPLKVKRDVVEDVKPLSADPEPEAVSEAIAQPQEDAAVEEQVSENVPAWVTETPPVEIVETDEDPVSEEARAVSASEETVAVVAEVIVVKAVVGSPSVSTTDPEPVVEGVAAVDPEQSFDEIVVTEEAVSGETAKGTAAEPEVQTEAKPVIEEVLAQAVSVEAAQEQESAVTAHAAYDVYLKDNEETHHLVAADPDEDSAPEEAAPASPEPVAQIGPSGDVRIEMDAKNAHVWNELGNVYFSTGAYDDAIVAYTKAIELDRWFAWPYSNLALAYMQKGRFAEATLLYQRSIELFSSEKDKAISWNRLGNVYRRLNDYDNAIAAYQRADELDPDNTALSLQSRFSLLGSFSLEQKPSYAN